METPMTPLEFARRARTLYPSREAVIDDDLRLTYEQFFDRCDRWSSVLQRQMAVRRGDRVAYIAPNTHAQLESFYAVPQLGAVLVPINYRLTAEDFAYIIQHSGARVLCAHPDYLDAIDRVRSLLPEVEHYVSLDGAARRGWTSCEQQLAAASPEFEHPEIAEGDLVSLNYTSGTTARPKGVMITHRNEWVNIVGTLIHLPLRMDDRYLWTLPMFHANGWTFVWVVTAVGGTHVCLPGVEATVIMKGYFNDPEATAAVMGDGWFHTGDAAVMHPDGYVEIRDRIKDVIISGGENISSVEVEGALLRHPAVQEAAIVGIPHPRWGEAPFAFIVLKEGAEATPDDLIAFARERLAHFKAPHGVQFVPELPKTATGKIQKYVLRKGAPAIVPQ